MPIQSSGEASGEITLKASGNVSSADILKFHPEIRFQLEDIARHGWEYLFIETRGTALAEIALHDSPYRISEAIQQGVDSGYVIEWAIGPSLPEVKSVLKVETFKVHLGTKVLPRAVTVDLATGTVTYLHDSFWKWQPGWEKDERRLLEARAVYDICLWAMDVKKYKLDQSLSPQRYNEVSSFLKALNKALQISR